MAVLQYSDDPRIEFYLKDYQDKTTLLDAIDTIPYKGKISSPEVTQLYFRFQKLSTYFIFQGGNTRTGDAIRYMMDKIFSIENGSRPSVKKHMVLLTDGRSQVNHFFNRTYDNSTFLG